MTNPSSGVSDFTSNVSGTANVKSTEDNHGKFSGYQYIFFSGQTPPSGAWYQVISGTISAIVPSQEITKVVNSLYVTPSNQNLAPFQSSGNSAPTANVPKSESTKN